MRLSSRFALSVFTASVLAVTAGAAALAQDNNPSNAPEMHGMQHWGADHEALLNAKLAGLKAGLNLSADQEKLWGPFEAAVRDAAKMRMEHMQEMMERMGHMGGMHHEDMGQMHEEDMGEIQHEGMGEMQAQGESMSPVDRLEEAADRLSQAGAALKKIADAAKPLYDSLDGEQKRIFAFLAPELMAMGRHPGAMGPWGHHPHHHGDEGGPDEE